MDLIDRLCKKPDDEHRGRIQAQGGGYEDSEAWNQTIPPTLAEGEIRLSTLVSRMPPRVYRVRDIAIEEARVWMHRAAAAGGVGPTSQSFQNPGVRKGERVDIEVIKGRAFTP
jgi:hypothetical protein